MNCYNVCATKYCNRRRFKPWLIITPYFRNYSNVSTDRACPAKRFGCKFETLARQHHSERSFRTASRWPQFVTMAMAQLAGRTSLRDIVDNISAQAHRLYHLSSATLSRSNLSRINDGKPYALYDALFEKLLGRCQGVVPGHDFRFKNPLYSLDASTIDLCLSVFPKGSVVVIDKGYNDYGWYNQLTGNGICFVTRLKTNTKTRAVCRRSVLKNKGLICDKIKSFVGISKNAVLTQIWIALCMYLLLAFLGSQSGLQKSTQQILRILQINLFEKRDLMALFRDDPPREYQPDINQMALL